MSHCTLCFSDATDYGEIFPNHKLLLHRGDYKIVNDHDEVYRFPNKPVLDPFDGKTDNQIENATETELLADEVYYTNVETMRKSFLFHPQLGHQIVNLCKQVGYVPEEHGWLDYWICSRSARMIYTKENLTPSQEGATVTG